jgi:hypothetical protein
MLAASIAMSTRPSLAQHSDDHGGHGRQWSGYQRKAFDWKDNDKRDHRRRHNQFWVSPRIESGWFQRPYPYHLDYYKMRYHGSYEPYFGNLYGPPEVVTAPPYYGPYYGGLGLGAEGYGAEYMHQYGGPNAGGFPMAPGPGAAVVEPSAPAQAPKAASKDEQLPAPVAE